MKISRFSLLVSLLLIGSFLLSGCTGSAAVNSWPGLSGSGDIAYLSFQGSMYAINVKTGAMIWRFPEKADPGKPFYAAPAISDDLIVAGNFGHMLYGINHNGQQMWAYDTENGNFAGSPLIAGDTVLAPSTNNKLYALSKDGQLRWTFETGNSLWTTPASDGKVAYLPALDHNMYALNLADGSLVWKKDLGSALLSAPLLTQDGTLYVTNMGGQIVALKSTDGSILWEAETGGRIWATPLLHEDALYVGNSEGKVVAVSVKDGSILWEADGGSPIVGGGALVTDGVAFPSESGSLVAFRFTGEKLWNQSVNGKLYTTPVVANDTLVAAVTQGDSLVKAFNLNGQPAWIFTAPK